VTARRALLTALAAAGIAFAQDGRVSFLTSGLVEFTVAPASFAAAAACPACAPLPPDPGPAIAVAVARQSPNRLYTIEVDREAWAPAVDLDLEVRFQVASIDGGTPLLTTDWLPLGVAPTFVFDQRAAPGLNRVRVDVGYRLALRGDEPPGSYLARVTLRVRENGSAVGHDVRVTLPSYLALRVAGRLLPVASTTVTFDYLTAPNAYLQAVLSGARLPPTNADLDRIELSTNHPSGATVTVHVDEVAAPEGPGLRERLWLGGAVAHGRTFGTTAPTVGFVPLWGGQDFSLRVEGDEAAGPYHFTVRYEAVRNP